LRQTVTLPLLDGRTVSELHDLRAAVARVAANGQPIGTVVGQPHSVDVTAALTTGENVIEIELVGALGNPMGLHHLRGGDLHWAAPKELRDKNRRTDDYILVPLGLDGARLTTLAYQTSCKSSSRQDPSSSKASRALPVRVPSPLLIRQSRRNRPRSPPKNAPGGY
jgi:hypothetical protein